MPRVSSGLVARNITSSSLGSPRGQHQQQPARYQQQPRRTGLPCVMSPALSRQASANRGISAPTASRHRSHLIRCRVLWGPTPAGPLGSRNTAVQRTTPHIDLCCAACPQIQPKLFVPLHQKDQSGGRTPICISTAPLLIQHCSAPTTAIHKSTPRGPARTSRHARLNEDLSRSSRRSAWLSLFCHLRFPPPLHPWSCQRQPEPTTTACSPTKKSAVATLFFPGPGKFCLLFPFCPSTGPSPAARPTAALNPKPRLNQGYATEQSHLFPRVGGV